MHNDFKNNAALRKSQQCSATWQRFINRLETASA
jgi:hypothetical protein